MQGFFAGNEAPYAQVPQAVESTGADQGKQEQDPKSDKDKHREPVPVFLPNAGIAAIIPAQKILEVLDYEELKLKQR